jgi:TetR/AcrR family transcriptional regulator, mexJK operon transcriptional repressor
MRVKSETRRLAYVEAAGRLFLEHGYPAVSMDMIAAAVGGSKVTLYNYFPSKEELFEAFVIEAGRGPASELLDIEISTNLPATLKAIGIAYLKLVTTPDVIALDRLIISEARRLPELTRIFYATGPKRTIDALSSVFASMVDKGWLRPSDPSTLAVHFKGLCEAMIVERQLWCLDARPSQATLTAAVATATEAFVNGYAAS